MDSVLTSCELTRYLHQEFEAKYRRLLMIAIPLSCAKATRRPLQCATSTRGMMGKGLERNLAFLFRSSTRRRLFSLLMLVEVAESFLEFP